MHEGDAIRTSQARRRIIVSHQLLLSDGWEAWPPKRADLNLRTVSATLGKEARLFRMQVGAVAWKFSHGAYAVPARILKTSYLARSLLVC